VFPLVSPIEVVATAHVWTKCPLERSPPGNNILTKAFPRRNKHEKHDVQIIAFCASDRLFLTELAETGHSLSELHSFLLSDKAGIPIKRSRAEWAALLHVFRIAPIMVGMITTFCPFCREIGG
jgi:hypothetical protein